MVEPWVPAFPTELVRGLKAHGTTIGGLGFLATTFRFLHRLSGCEKSADQPIDFARLLHMREVPRLLDDMDGQASRQRFGV
jgi:hypothetical protein